MTTRRQALHQSRGNARHPAAPSSRSRWYASPVTAAVYHEARSSRRGLQCESAVKFGRGVVAARHFCMSRLIFPSAFAGS